VAAAVIRAGPAFALLFRRGWDGWGRAAQLVLGARRTQGCPVSRPIVEGRTHAPIKALQDLQRRSIRAISKRASHFNRTV
jgi:hypothetical protein